MPQKDPEQKRVYFAARYIAQREKFLAASRQRYENNREAILTQAADYREANREILAAKSRARYAIKREEIRAKNVVYRTVNSEKIRKQRQTAYSANRAHKLAQHKESMRRNPELAITAQRRRRARKAHAPVNDLTAKQWHTIQNHFHHRCAYCGRKPNELTQDHITPLSRGGSHTIQNVIPACRPCNAKKGNKAVHMPIQPLFL